MDIREYNVKKLPYHFVLFYDVENTELLLIKLTCGGGIEDNAFLAYCYLDLQCGLSYKVICCAYIDEDGNVSLSTDGKKTSGYTIREGGVTGQAVLYKEGGDLQRFQDEVDFIKECYGYYPEKVALHENEAFSAFRHPMYPKDILVSFFDEEHKREKMWVTELGTDENGWLSAKLLNEPYSPKMGIHEGDIVKVVPVEDGQGDPLPLGLVPWMRKMKMDVMLKKYGKQGLDEMLEALLNYRKRD